jgi:hypothetical protein
MRNNEERRRTERNATVRPKTGVERAGSGSGEEFLVN